MWLCGTIFNQTQCALNVTLLLWARLQRMCATPRERKSFHKDKKSELDKCTIGTSKFWEIGFDQDRTGNLQGAGWPETRVKTRLAILSFCSGFTNSQLTSFQTQNNFWDWYTKWKCNESIFWQNFWAYQILAKLSACLNATVEYCSKGDSTRRFQQVWQQKKCSIAFSTKEDETKMKQRTKNSRLLFFVDCGSLRKNRHKWTRKENSYLQLLLLWIT